MLFGATGRIHIDVRVKLNPGAGDIGGEVNRILNELMLASVLQLTASSGG